MININIFQENKEKIIGVFLIGLNIIFFYFCCIAPYNKLKLKRETVREGEIKLKKVSKEKEIVEKIYNSKIEKEKEIENRFKNNREKIIAKSFKNINEFEKTILEKLKKYNLYSQIIGRVEKLSGETEGKAYISYEIIGKEKNIKEFIQELENGEKLISLVETPIYLAIKRKIAIINGLQNYFGMHLPVFVDYAAELDDSNMKSINADCQIIFLKVTNQDLSVSAV